MAPPKTKQVVPEGRRKETIPQRTPLHIQYRIPRAWATALQMAKSPYGRCEEHAFYALYLLTIGHMVQKMPFGRLVRD
jgi:hypothetical protein